MTYTVSHFIDGKPTPGQSNHTLDIFNPATGKITGQVTLANSNEVHQAIVSAKAALSKWSVTPIARRVEILYKFNALLHEHLDELAEMISREHGKTLPDARGELARGIEVVELACNAPTMLKGDYSAGVATGVDTYSVRQPVGVCAGITPFNFPAMIGLWMYPLAIVCGNTFVLKPSERDPSCSVRFAELFKQAGLPDGVLNVIQGDKEAVDILLTHPDVNAISFVGSTPIAKYVYETAAANGKRVQCGGSAKNIAVIMPDADIEQTAAALLGAAYGSAGERCMAISVVVAIGDAVGDALVDQLTALSKTVKIGDGMANDIDMGPLVTAAHQARVKAYVDLGVQEGAKLVVDGRNYKNSDHAGGYYLGPCLFDKVTPEMRIYREEIFGPVLCVLRAPDVETAIQWISEHEYGNGTAIFTRDGYAAHEFAMRVPVGMVGINVPIPVPVGYQSFGGWKNSFFGDIGMYGAEGFRFYTKIKTITQRWPVGKMVSDFNIPNSKS